MRVTNMNTFMPIETKSALRHDVVSTMSTWQCNFACHGNAEGMS